jgi:hypothetical protein
VDLKGPLSKNYFCSSNEYFQNDLRTITLFQTSIFSKPISRKNLGKDFSGQVIEQNQSLFIK